MVNDRRNKRGFLRLLSVLLLVCGILMVAGCKIQLYGGLTEDEANEMMGLLLKHGISCEKAPGQEQSFVLMVDDRMVATALNILQQNGYPKPKFKSMGEIFRREGMVSSPMEERVRFMYALSQEIAETITQIDGVLSARVHIVLPENNPLNEKSMPSAASVFIKHRSDVDIALLTPRIKSLVANSIEGLTYDRVAVVLVDAQPPTPPQPDAVTASSGVSVWLTVAIALVALLSGAGIGGGIVLWLGKKSSGQVSKDAQ
ncbi:MAG: type III secretion system inner membrane ring lipoprotein SctJ [Thermodesulforhabdaceae bacterium]